MEESTPGLALKVVLASAKAAQRRLGRKDLFHCGYATAGVAGAEAEGGEGGEKNMTGAGAVAEEHMVGESVTEQVTEQMVEGEELRSMIAGAVEAGCASEAESLIAPKGVNSRFENIMVVAVVQQGVDCSLQCLGGFPVGMDVEHRDAESERKEGAEDSTVVVGSVIDIAVATVVGIAVVAGFCAAEDTFEVGTEVVVSGVRLDIGCIAGGAVVEARSREGRRRRIAGAVQMVCRETGEVSDAETERTSASSPPESDWTRNPASLAPRRPGQGVRRWRNRSPRSHKRLAAHAPE